MNNNLKSQLTKLLNDNITAVSTVSGGDISQAFRIDTATNSYFLKLNNAPNAVAMFQSEAYALEKIAQTKTIKTPKVVAFHSFEDFGFLLLEFIESKPPSSKDFKTFGKHLAKLHQCTSSHFGLDQDNFIGQLPQSNTQHEIWVDFYTIERLMTQLELAKKKGLLQGSEIPTQKLIKHKLQSLFAHIKPSLLHGDLWSGNYLISTDGAPYLIDPALYYGHSKVDIAMSKLFGGFDDAFYEAYFNIMPKDNFSDQQIAVYQLYYLLVHLNMFGRTYHGSVVSILRSIFV